MTAVPHFFAAGSTRRILRSALLGLGAAFVAIQLVPRGREHVNPPVVAEPSWDSPATRAAFMRSCADCHSNQTKWPWYSHIAPISWLIEKDVREARQEFNVSEWGRAENHGDEAAEEVGEGAMPLPMYLRFHPEARLTASEREAFVRGLRATFGVDEGSPGQGNGEDMGRGEGGDTEHDD